MATYAALRAKYVHRQREELIDTISAGLSRADELMVDLGFFEGLGDAAELLDSIFSALPFVLIIATEGTKVVLGKKPGVAATRNAAFRVVKTGAAMAVGAGVAVVAGSVAAIPAAVGTRLLLERAKVKGMLGRRVEKRIETMAFLRRKWRTDLPEDLALPVKIQEM